MLRIPVGAGPGLHFLAPARRPWLLAFSRPGSWLYARMIGVQRIDVDDIERLVERYRDMQEGRSRFIVAFRHPSTDDPPVMFRLLTALTSRSARRLGARLRWPPRAHFLYGRDLPEWSGRWLAWFLPLIGAISVFPGKGDAASFSVIRRTLSRSRHPVALAPEAQVNYHDGIVSALEDGAAQMAFWCLEDVTRSGSTAEVFLLPVRLAYHFGEAGWKGIARLLDRIEDACGLPRLAQAPLERPWDRVMRAAGALVATAEGHYARFHGTGTGAGEDLQQRISAVVEAALGVVERAFAMRPRGDWVQRVQAARYVGLGRIHRDDIEDPARLAPLDRALADRAAAEAWLALRHMELVDLLEYVRMDYLSPGSGVDRYAEMVGNLWDMVNRLRGGNVGGRVGVGPRTARVSIAEPIPVSRFLEGYRRNRRAGIAALTDELCRALKGPTATGS